MFPINEVLQGDCTRVLRRLPDSFVDLVITDPPYGVRYQDSHGRTIANDDDPNRILGAFTDLYRVLKPDSICISFYGWGQVDTFFRAWRRAGFRPVGHIVWAKDYASRTRYLHYRHEQAYVLAKGSPKMPEEPIDDIQPWVYSGNQDHPTQKAVQILTPLIEAFSQPGQLVLDPFAGSGSTLVAAAISGRRYLGVELAQGYCRVARERLVRVHTRLPQPLPMRAVLDQEELDLVPADVDGFIQWLREHQLEGVARVVESARRNTAGELSFAACGPHDITKCHAAHSFGAGVVLTAWRLGNACGAQFGKPPAPKCVLR